MDYISLGDAPDWTLGITICYFRPDTRFVHFDHVQYIESDRILLTVVNGKDMK